MTRSIFLCLVVYLFASFEGVVGASGENTYSHHSGSRTARGGGEVDRLNRAYGVKKIKEAQCSLGR